jgi:hypothetical protein
LAAGKLSVYCAKDLERLQAKAPAEGEKNALTPCPAGRIPLPIARRTRQHRSMSNVPSPPTIPAEEWLTENDIERAAHLIMSSRGKYAARHARLRADDLRQSGNFEAEAIWRRIVEAIERLKA